MAMVLEVKKRPGLRLIVLEDGEVLRLPYALFRLKPLKAGLALPPGYHEMMAKQAPQAALEQAGRMLALRDHSVQEVSRKLLEQAYSQEVVHSLIDRLCATKLLDDRRFAMGLARRLGKKYGPRRLAMQLHQKGIHQELIDEVLSEQDTGEQLDAALKAAQKALKRRGEDPRMDARRAYAALARRGYDAQVAKEAVKRAMAVQDDEFMEDEAGF